MVDGWISLYRQLQDNRLWLLEPFTQGQAWVDLLLLANHMPGLIDKRGIRIDLKRGQCGWSELSLSYRWKWSRGKVLRFLKYLEQQEMIKTEQQINKVSTIITICNYDIYQGTEQQTEQQNGQQTDNKRTLTIMIINYPMRSLNSVF